MQSTFLDEELVVLSEVISETIPNERESDYRRSLVSIQRDGVTNRAFSLPEYSAIFVAAAGARGRHRDQHPFCEHLERVIEKADRAIRQM